MPKNDQRSVTRAARRLNEHHLKTGAGFYPNQAAGGGRCFSARVRRGTLQIWPGRGGSWLDVNLVTAAFTDHNGRPIFI